MAISVKHSFNSPKTDGPDSTLVQPSNWNAEHAITLAAGKVLGRDTGSAGVVQELPIAVDTAGNVAIGATGFFSPAIGTTAQRPATPAAGQFRFNSSLGKYEGYDGSVWKAFESASDVNSENRIINGDFGVWQRGTSFTASAYGADRWANYFVGGAVTTSQQAFALGDTLGANQPTYFLRQTVSGQSGTNLATIQQRIEGVRSYAGQTITILGWARRSSGAGNLSVRVTQVFGTGGSPSADVGVTQQIITLSGAWQAFAVTFSVPSLAGKTLGTSGTDSLYILFDTSNGESGAVGLQTIGVDLWGIHIRQGTWTAADAALYRPRDPGTEFALCQRYYWKGLCRCRFRAAVVSDVGSDSHLFPVQLRAAPNAQFVSNSYTNNVASVNVANPTADGFAFEVVANAVGDTFRGDIYGFDSEL